MNSLVRSSRESTELKFGWDIEGFQSIDKYWADFKSSPFDLFPGCCCLKFTISRKRDADDKEFEYTIGAVSANQTNHLDYHLAEKHKYYRRLCTMYILGNKCERRFLYEPGGGRVADVPFKFKAGQEGTDDHLNFLDNGCLKFRVELELMELKNNEAIFIKPLDLIGDLSVNFGHLLDTGEHTDFTIETADESFEVHKAVLAARSPVFKAMLSANMRESTENVLKLDSVSATVMKSFLRYLYTDKLELIVKQDQEPTKDSEVAIAMDLLRLGDQYQIPRLKALSEQNLSKNLSTDTIFEVLQLADTYGAENLRGNALQFVKHHKSSLISQDDISGPINQSPELRIDILKALSSS